MYIGVNRESVNTVHLGSMLYVLQRAQTIAEIDTLFQSLDIETDTPTKKTTSHTGSAPLIKKKIAPTTQREGPQWNSLS